MDGSGNSSGICSRDPIFSQKIAGNDKCVVCGAVASGLHFGVKACMACTAFFRRSVIEKRTYECRQQQTCNIIFDSSNRKLCRFCRLRKCFCAGMLPYSEFSYYIFELILQSKPDKSTFFPSQANVLLSGFDCSTAKQENGEKRINCKVLSAMLPTNSAIALPPIIDSVEFGCSVNEYAFKHSLLEEKRMQRYSQNRSRMNNEVAKMENYFTILHFEPDFVSKFLSSTGSFKELTDSDQRAVFKNYLLVARVLEQARITAFCNGIEYNRVHLLDGSFIDATEEGLVTFYGSGNSLTETADVMDPAMLARMSLPSTTFHLRKLVTNLQNLDINAVEFAALLNLLLWDPAIPDLSLLGMQIVRRRRQHIVNEICHHYNSSPIDFPIRLANLISLMPPIQENTRMWIELLLIIELMKTDKTMKDDLLPTE